MKRKYDEVEKDSNNLSKLPEEREDSSTILNDNLTFKKPLLKGDREEIKTFIRIRQIENDPGKNKQNFYLKFFISRNFQNF
jgi:hypothetical protein